MFPQRSVLCLNILCIIILIISAPRSPGTWINVRFKLFLGFFFSLFWLKPRRPCWSWREEQGLNHLNHNTRGVEGVFLLNICLFFALNLTFNDRKWKMFDLLNTSAPAAPGSTSRSEEGWRHQLSAAPPQLTLSFTWPSGLVVPPPIQATNR